MLLRILSYNYLNMILFLTFCMCRVLLNLAFVCLERKAGIGCLHPPSKPFKKSHDDENRVPKLTS